MLLNDPVNKKIYQDFSGSFGNRGCYQIDNEIIGNEDFDTKYPKSDIEKSSDVLKLYLEELGQCGSEGEILRRYTYKFCYWKDSWRTSQYFKNFVLEVEQN